MSESNFLVPICQSHKKQGLHIKSTTLRVTRPVKLTGSASIFDDFGDNYSSQACKVPAVAADGQHFVLQSLWRRLFFYNETWVAIWRHCLRADAALRYRRNDVVNNVIFDASAPSPSISVLPIICLHQCYFTDSHFCYSVFVFAEEEHYVLPCHCHSVFVPVFVLVHDNNTITGYCKCETHLLIAISLCLERSLLPCLRALVCGGGLSS